jgi:hypothetical protein
VTADAGVEDLRRELAPRVLGGLVRRYEDPDHPGGASVGQPVQHHRTQVVQPDLQRHRRGAALATAADWAQVREALGKPAQHLNGQGRAWAV